MFPFGPFFLDFGEVEVFYWARIRIPVSPESISINYVGMFEHFRKKKGFAISYIHVPFLSQSIKSVYGLKIPKYRLNTYPNLKKIQTIYGLYLTKIQT